MVNITDYPEALARGERDYNHNGGCHAFWLKRSADSRLAALRVPGMQCFYAAEARTRIATAWHIRKGKASPNQR